jgi:GNAT superfamily N-acetyltransferase
MRIIPVSDKQTRRMFLDVVKLIYKDDTSYIQPLDIQIEEIFDPASNDFYKHGDAMRFVLLDYKNTPIGRVAAFINKKKAFGFAQPTGGMGFFECINDKDAAFLLFDTAKTWLTENGMEAMDGPVNFGENDTFWGLLVEGFTPPGFGMQYNPPYYQEFFESYGFSIYFEQVTNHLDLQKPFPERFWKIAGRVVAREDYSFQHFKKKETEKFIGDFVEIYNDAWQFHDNFTPMDPDTLRKSLKEASGFMDQELIWFAYYKNEPIGFLVMFPDVNQIIRHFKGKFTLFNKLQFLYYKWRNEMTRTRVVIMGVKPKYQRMGIESGIFWNLRDVVAKRTYLKEMELSWVGDFNPKMRAVHESMGATFGKRHITYRYIFDPAKRSSQRAVSIPVDTKSRLTT